LAGGADTTAAVLYGLINSSVVKYDDIKESIRYITKRLEQGTTENVAVESTTLKILHKLDLIPNSLSKYLKDKIELTGKVFRFPKLFICYAKEDEEKAQSIYLEFKKERFFPWMDSPPFLYINEGLKPGEDFNSTIRKEIKEADYFIALLSNSSIKKKAMYKENSK